MNLRKEGKLETKFELNCVVIFFFARFDASQTQDTFALAGKTFEFFVENSNCHGTRPFARTTSFSANASRRKSLQFYQRIFGEDLGCCTVNTHVSAVPSGISHGQGNDNEVQEE